ncbi:dienelactone hydrolase family protein [Roseateles sp.]|uniref:dienelactone hydrolase family protein n=1 Tax=Roseateles sp. TaxID=1971397 RepID=UPI00286AECD8|nr:dienelactone hydrolase family protein [Roseateles sp.]
MGRKIEFQRPDGAKSAAYLAEANSSEGLKRPGLILIQEWWGLNPQICGVADRFAAAGFTTMAPDLYRGRLASDADEASHLMTGLDFGDATQQDLAGALAFLLQHCSKVGVTGFCMGGALTIAAAVHLKGLSAASCFYGIPPAELADPATIGIPFQAHFANQDDWCTPAAADALQAQLAPSAEIHRYAAQHGFFNERRPEVFDADAAALAWKRTLTFLRRHLIA